MHKRNDYGYVSNKQGWIYHYTNEDDLWKRAKWYVIPAVILTILLGFVVLAHAQVVTPMPAYSNEQIADAIYLAEGGSKTNHPYGILAKYKHTTPRQACINTIKHARRDWDGQGDFITFLGNRYCPVGAKNDPQGLNKNWIKNVKYFLNKGVSNG